MKDAMPEIEWIFGRMFWVCGFCNEPIREIKDTATADNKYNPNYCPH